MVVINWLKGNDTVDRGEYEPGSEVEIRSVFHTENVDAYEIYERPPKVLKFFERADRWATSLPARPLAPVPGRYHTEKNWRLPRPPDNHKKNGRLTFVAKVGNASSGIITSASMLISSEVLKDNTEDSLKGSLESKLPGAKGTVEAAHKSGRERTINFKVQPTLDPEVEIRLLQGGEVRAHIDELVDEWFEGSAERSAAKDVLRGGLAEYFNGGRQLKFDPVRTTLVPPDAVSYPLPVTASDNLRAVMCLQVDDLEHNTTTISEPRFITVVNEHIVMSDLVPVLFDDQTKALAKMFSDQLRSSSDGQLSAEATKLGAQLVDVLGTGDVDDVIALVSLK